MLSKKCMCWCFIHYWIEKCTVKQWNTTVYLNSHRNKSTPISHTSSCVNSKWLSKITTRFCRFKPSVRKLSLWCEWLFCRKIKTYCLERTESHLIFEPKFDVKLIVLLASRGVKLMLTYLEERNIIISILENRNNKKLIWEGNKQNQEKLNCNKYLWN